LAGLTLSLGSYALIAVGRSHQLHDSNLATALQLRYQYAATAPFVLAYCVAVRQLLLRLSFPAWVKSSAVTVCLGLALSLYARYGPSLIHHQLARHEVARVYKTIKARIAAAPSGSTVRIANRPANIVVGTYWIKPTAFPGWAGLFVLLFDQNIVDGRRVVFTDADAEVVDAAAHGRRTASLIVHAAQTMRPTRSRLDHTTTVAGATDL
jgi:hypothetical protein